MPPERLREELRRAGRLITRWRIELTSAFWAATLLAAVWLFSLSDLYLQFQRTGRLAIWILLVGLLTAALVNLTRALMEKHSVMGVAARLELAFPELDNHLINYLQFSANAGGDSFKSAYVRQGVPQWSRIDLRNMKNRTAQRRVNAALAAAAILMALPLVFRGDAWAVAVSRIVNPFSDMQPLSATRIVAVRPGDASALQGTPVVLSCRVAGVSGHKVHVDVQPADDRKSAYLIGSVTGTTEEVFSYKIPKLTTPVRYRFRAGDSPPTRWHQLDARPPLAATAIRLEVRPPAYTGIGPQVLDGMSEEVLIPQGSTVLLGLQCNSRLRTATARPRGGNPIDLAPPEQGETWTATLPLDAGDALELAAISEHGEALTYTVRYTVIPDKPPTIDILAPAGKNILPPGAVPEIEFAAADDYGLTGIAIERIPIEGAQAAAGQVIGSWQPGDAREFAQRWKDDQQTPLGAQTMAFVITARDNRPDGGNEIKSAPILFNAVSLSQAEEARSTLDQNAAAALAKVVTLQKENIDTTRKYIRVLEGVNAPRWQALAENQTVIRNLTKEILANPVRPLGNLTETVRKIYLNEMTFVVDELGRIPDAQSADQSQVAANALNMEEKILRYLTSADAASAQSKAEQQASLVDGLLKALIDGESDLIARTKPHADSGAAVGKLLVEKQDRLATDLSEFVRACGTAADLIRVNQPALAAAYEKAAAASQEKKVREDMILAAERLDGNLASQALTHESNALAKLEQIQADLTSLKAAADEKRQEEMLETLGAAKEKIAKIKELHRKAIETMEMVKANQSLDAKDIDMMEEEYEELLKQTKQAMLEVPTDLHIFQELNVANEMVEDVITIFQETEQEEGTEDALVEGKVTETAFTKDMSIELLELLEQAEDRVDDFEMWLNEVPDTNKITVEAMDMEEMPPEGAALGALESKVEDIIGDLLQESEDPEEQEKADDSAVNRAVSDIPMGAGVTEGDVASFAGKGKSGNIAPDHKEQDGRSNVGRQGMSSGETSAGSGTISEGDDNIEARRTQDPTASGQVDAEGEADTKAFGGGKQGTGRADDVGDGMGGSQRMDSNMAGGGPEGMQGLMVDLERMYDQASMKNVRAPSLKLAAHHIRQAGDAIAEARPIEQIEELKQKAVAALKKAATELGGAATTALDTGRAANMLGDAVEGGPDDAPPRYRSLVNEYYRALNDEI